MSVIKKLGFEAVGSTAICAFNMGTDTFIGTQKMNILKRGWQNKIHVLFICIQNYCKFVH